MFFQKHTYVFSETHVCFFRNIPMIFRRDRGVFSRDFLCVSLRALFQAHTTGERSMMLPVVCLGWSGHRAIPAATPSVFTKAGVNKPVKSGESI